MARDRATQAVLGLRGKVLNTWRSDISTIDKNKEISDIIACLGTGKGKDFDIEKLKYHKIILLADADVDGEHITVLLLTLFYKFMRPLIENGHIYIAMSPKYKIRNGKNYEYAATDAHLEAYKAKHPGAKLEITYIKGLGELDAEDLELTTTSKETRMLKRVNICDAEKATITFEKLMGESPSVRKEFIQENAHKANLD